MRLPELGFVEAPFFVPSELPAHGSRVVSLSAEAQNLGASAATATVRFDVIDQASGATLVSATSTPVSLAPGGPTAVAAVQLTLPASVRSWSISAPALYTVAATLLSGAGDATDALNVTAGWRSTRWDPDTGFYLNSEPVKQRGFSHHVRRCARTQAQAHARTCAHVRARARTRTHGARAQRHMEPLVHTAHSSQENVHVA